MQAFYPLVLHILRVLNSNLSDELDVLHLKLEKTKMAAKM